STNGAFGSGRWSVVTVAGERLLEALGRAVALLPDFALGRDFKNETICQRCRTGRMNHAGMPLRASPCVTYQNTSPGAAVCVAPVVRSGMLPVPWAFLP